MTQLQQYIEDVKILETYSLTLSRAIAFTEQKIQSLCIPKNIQKEENQLAKEKNGFFYGSIIYLVITGIIVLIQCFVGWPSKVDDSGLFGWIRHQISTIVFIALLVFAGLGIFCIIMYIVRKKGEQAAEEQIEINYAIDRVIDQGRLDSEKVLRDRYLKARQEMIRLYQTVSQTLDRLYDKNVIYKKYRHDLVALCSFSEYLASGQCNQLEGHEGAYNLYEEDVRWGKAMAKLDIIIEKIDEIRYNQQEICRMIQNVNAQQQIIIDGFKRMEKIQGQIAENTAMTAYNVEVMRRQEEIARMYYLY